MENSSTTESIPKAKTSKLAIASLVLVIIGLFVSAIWMALLLLMPAVILGIVAIVKIKRSNGRLKGRWIAVLAITISTILLLIVGIFCFFSLDAPPIPDDYTIADLRSAGPGHAESYQLLISLADEEGIDPNSAPAIGLNAQDVRTVSEIHDQIEGGDLAKITEVVTGNAESIERIWEKAIKGRDIIGTLAEFQEVVDLTELEFGADVGFVKNLRRLSRLYFLYVFLRAEQGYDQEAVTLLVELDSVFRKLSINHRGIIVKLVCIVILKEGIRAANFVVNKPDTEKATVEFLARHFNPLLEPETSMKNTFIAEYLILGNILDDGDNVLFEGESVFPKLCGTPLLKRNSLLRLYRNDVDHWIAVSEGKNTSEKPRLSVWPNCYFFLPEVSFDMDFEGVLVPCLPWYYFCYNPLGSMLMMIMAPAYDKVANLNMWLKIHDDLLQIVLNKRLGREVSLKARAYSDEYIIDMEKKIIFSPGPDGESYTKDDIKLPINPQVLNLTQ